jgi:hypothetical protein
MLTATPIGWDAQNAAILFMLISLALGGEAQAVPAASAETHCIAGDS